MGFGRRGYYRATLRMVLEQEWIRHSYPWTRAFVKRAHAMGARTL